MQVGGFSGSAAIWLNSLGKAPEVGVAEAFSSPAELEAARQKEQARSAASNTSFPTVAPVALDAATLLALQGDDAGTHQQADDAGLGNANADGESGAVRDFLDFMKKSPEERLRDKILKALGVTEEDLAAMPKDERLVIENKIRDIIKETIVKPEGQAGTEREKAEADLASRSAMLDLL